MGPFQLLRRRVLSVLVERIFWGSGADRPSDEYFGDHESNVPMSIEEYVEHLDAESLLKSEATRALAADKVLAGGPSKATLEVSPSDCLRLDLSKYDAAALVRRFRSQQ